MLMYKVFILMLHSRRIAINCVVTAHFMEDNAFLKQNEVGDV